MSRAELVWIVGKLAVGHAGVFGAAAWLNATERARRVRYIRQRMRRTGAAKA